METPPFEFDPPAVDPRSFLLEQGLGENSYEHIKEIGRGGYGQVHLFRRRHRSGNADYVAGKFVYRQMFGPEDDPASAAAYERTVSGLENFRTLSTDSPYVLRIFDVWQRHAEGCFGYMMELADDLLGTGSELDPIRYRPRTLKHLLERTGGRQRLPAAQCIEVARGLATGLHLLHEAGFTHRDVRPSNIIFIRGLPKLADIDLLAEHDPALTSYIPKHYAAPEGGHSHQADLFSLGRTLYEMSTGLAVQNFPCLPTDVRFWADHELFLRLNQVMATACAPDVQDRFRSARQFLEALPDLNT
jgi:serine/threonine protein kinase